LPDALGAGGIDGYCVGEPWNSIGVADKGAHIATVKASIWQSSPDKVIGMRTSWAEQHPDAAAAVIRAIYRAGVWCGDASNHAEIAEIMSGSAYLAAPAEIVGRALSGMLDTGAGAIRQVPDFFVPHASAANFPWKSHALWYYSQMVRWGEVMASPANAEIAAAAFRPDLYRAALASMGVAVPAEDYKIDGAQADAHAIAAIGGEIVLRSDLFFDGRVFDPDQLGAYIRSQSVD
jgi:NitT/TauT family transport system ATP-binding protein